MKKGEKPKLDYNWWNKNKPKTLTKTGLGAALRVYQARVEKFRLAEALGALKDIDKAVNNAIKKGNKTFHKETIATLKLYQGSSGLIKTEEKRLIAEINKADKIKASAPIKQKKLGADVLWQRDIGVEFMKKYGSKHKWIKTLKGGDVRLALDGSILDAIKTEGEQVLAMRMIDQCNKIFNSELLPELDVALTKAEKNTSDAGLLNAFFPAAIKRMEKSYGPKFQKVPASIWSGFIAKKQQYKDYKIDTAFEIGIASLKLVGSGLTIAAAVPTGGATLALGIYGGVQTVSDSARIARDAFQEAETVLKRLEKSLVSLRKDWLQTKSKAKSAAKSMGATFADTIISYPVLPTIGTCEKDYKLADNKIAGLDVKHVKLGKDVGKVLKDLDKLEKILNKADKKVVAKAMKDLIGVRKNMMKVLDQTHDMGKRVGDAEEIIKNMKKLLAELDKGTPGYIKAFDTWFPVVHNLALAGANAGIGFADAKTALDTANTAIGLSNDLLGEVKGQLS